MKRQISILLLLVVALAAHALDSRQTRINEIKKSKEYLYSDITMETPESAMSVALNELQQRIISWASDRTGHEIKDVNPVELNKLIDTIMVRRADMYRVFAYAKKFSLAASPCFIGEPLALDGERDSDDSTTPDKPSQEAAQAASSSAQPKDSVVSQDVIGVLRSNFLGRKGGVLEKIKAAKNFFELKEIMEPLKDKGEITGYGKYATALNPETCYLIVYDIAGNIKALLGKGDKVRQNLKTGKADDIHNYNGCGAIWFTIKE